MMKPLMIAAMFLASQLSASAQQSGVIYSSSGPGLTVGTTTISSGIVVVATSDLVLRIRGRLELVRDIQNCDNVLAIVRKSPDVSDAVCVQR